MVLAHRPWMAVVAFGLFCPWASSQVNGPSHPTVPAPAIEAAPVGSAATVNGQAVPEKAVARSLRRYPENMRAGARPDILSYLIDNVLIDQEMVRRNIPADKKEIDARLEQFRTEIRNEGKDPAKKFEELWLTEEDLRAQTAAEIRWEKLCKAAATEKALRELFETQPAMFNGSLVRARHILVSPADPSTKAAEQAHERIGLIRKYIEGQVSQEMAKLDPKLDGLKREEARIRLVDAAFAEAAGKWSMCPSKEMGGDLGWFPRAGKMVEPFAKVAFALKPYQLSDVVTTAFGQHLILALEIKPGKPVSFEDAREMVKDAFCDRLRDAFLAKLRPAAKIVISPGPK